MKAFAVVIIALLAAFFAYGVGRGQVDDDGRVQVDTVYVTPAAYQARLADLVIENTGLRARLEGVRTLVPDTVFRVDTLVAPGDTVIRFVSVDSRGRLSVELLTAVDDSLPNLRRPTLQTGIIIPNCDDGLYVGPEGTRCDPAQLGHLWVGVEASRHPSLIAWWSPHYRSPWQVSASYDGRRFDFGVRRGLRIF